jgi:aspartyl-tRNA(Asn)/glutamyl-tRNA(Gln) amidotransferase subunit A
MQAALARGEARASTWLQASLSVIREREPQLHAFLHLAEESARSSAEQIDATRPEARGRLAGVPLAIKDNLVTHDMPTTAASRILEGYRSPFDATAVQRLRAAGAVPVGKTNMDEFGMGSSTENSAYGPTRNPHDPDRVPGGSSGGSAAAVAAGMVPVALGSDTGGSVRQPAALCGIVGLKPSYGRVSRYGLIAYGSSLDTVGLFGRSVADVARVLGVIAGPDPRDGTSVETPCDDYESALDQPLPGLRLGVPREYFAEGLDPEVADRVREALAAYERQGATLVEVSLPHTSYALAVYYLVATAEASSNLARYDGVHYGQRAASATLGEMYERSRGAGFGPEVKRRIMLGTHALSSGYRDAYYQTALKARRRIQQDYLEAFAVCDAIAGPTSPTTAFRLGERLDDPLAMYLADIYTIGANLAGLPAISIPCGRSAEGLPIGLQLQAPLLAEARLLRIARMHENASRLS